MVQKSSRCNLPPLVLADGVCVDGLTVLSEAEALGRVISHLLWWVTREQKGAASSCNGSTEVPTLPGLVLWTEPRGPYIFIYFSSPGL